MINFKCCRSSFLYSLLFLLLLDRMKKYGLKKGLASIDDGDYKKAVECFDEAIKINPSYGEAWYKKRCCYL